MTTPASAVRSHATHRGVTVNRPAGKLIATLAVEDPEKVRVALPDAILYGTGVGGGWSDEMTRATPSPTSSVHATPATGVSSEAGQAAPITRPSIQSR